MKTLIFTLALTLSHASFAAPLFSVDGPTDSLEKAAEIANLEEILDEAESTATPEGLAILQTGRSMIAHGEVVLGSCWDYINALFDRAGFPSRSRATIHRGKYPGPYAAAEIIQAGDWLYYINHSYNDVEHSGVFITWLDFETREALILSYPGGNRQAPGRYRSYVLTHVFNIMRPTAI